MSSHADLWKKHYTADVVVNNLLQIMHNSKLDVEQCELCGWTMYSGEFEPCSINGVVHCVDCPGCEPCYLAQVEKEKEDTELNEREYLNYLHRKAGREAIEKVLEKTETQIAKDAECTEKA